MSKRGGSEIAIDATTLSVLIVVFIATPIRSAFGFDEALIAVPLLAFFMPLEVAAPLAVLLSITIAAIVVARDWDQIHLRSTGWLPLSTLFGIPLGLMLLTCGHRREAKGALAVILIAFCAYSLMGRTPLELRRDSRGWLCLFEFCAGVLGGAYRMNGPPLALYGAMRRWPAQKFRATLQGYFLPASVVRRGGHWLAGLWVPAVTHYYLLSLPVARPAVFLGGALNRRLNGAVLAIVGAVLLTQAIAGRLR